ncbi:T6SS immunity protein Tli4 family protein [Enterobacter sp. CFBP8995]|nr:T6SS immunity protein Tli4 family protein [Enterobacter sp. CFBP8995]
MRKIYYPLLALCSLISTDAVGQEWKNECVGYYQMELPEGLEIALYAVKNLTHPPREPKSDYGALIQRTRKPVITFGDAVYENGNDRVQAQFSEFYYGQYKLGISSKSTESIDFSAYKEKIRGDYEFLAISSREREIEDLRVLHEPLTPDDEFRRLYGFLIKEYNNAFTIYQIRGYTIQANSGNRLYQFWPLKDKYKEDKSQTAENQWHKKEPEVKSLLSRFSPRELYEVPTKQGFCIPYGFIANDSGQEPHNMAVTYRLKEHPDVTIFIQDLGQEPSDGFIRPENESEKDFITYLWEHKYQWGSVYKDLISPKWRTIEMDGRKGLGTFAMAEFSDGRVDYGYAAYVRGNHNARNVQPDLLVYVMQYSVQAKDRPPMDKKELEKMAERIVASVKRR